MAENGQWVGGVAPIGYQLDRETHHLRVCPEEAKLVEKVIELSLGQRIGENHSRDQSPGAPSGHLESVPPSPSVVCGAQEGEEVEELLSSHPP